MSRLSIAAVVALTATAAAAAPSPTALTPAGENAHSVALAVDGNGGAVALWRAGDRYALAARAGAKKPWSAPQTLASGSGVGYVFDVAVDAAGDAVAVWLEGPCTEYPYFCRRQIRASTRTGHTGSWSAPAALTTGEEDAFKHGGGSSGLDVDFDGARNATAVWLVGPAGPMIGYPAVEVVQAATWSPARGWSARTTISGDGQQPEGAVVDVAANGLAVAAWRSYAGAQNDSAVHVAVRPAGEAGFRPSERLSLPGQFAVDPRIGVGRNRAVVLYRAGDAIVARAWTAASGWTAPAVLSEKGASHQVAIDGRGAAIAVWSSGFDGYAATLAPSSTTWSRPVDVTASDVDAVAANDRGDAVFVSGPSAAGGTVYVYRYSLRTGKWSPSSRVGEMKRNPGGEQSSLEPAVAVGSDGEALVAWTSFDGTAYRGLVRRPGTPPAQRAKARVTGSAKVGSTLTCHTGTWTGDKPIEVTVKWYRGAAEVATTLRYRVKRADRGKSLLCSVRAENEFGYGFGQAASPRVR